MTQIQLGLHGKEVTIRTDDLTQTECHNYYDHQELTVLMFPASQVS